MDNNKEQDFKTEEIKEEERVKHASEPKVEKGFDFTSIGIIFACSFVIFVTVVAILLGQMKTMKDDMVYLNDKVRDISNIQGALITNVANVNVQELKDDVVANSHVLANVYEVLSQYDLEAMKLSAIETLEKIDKMKDNVRRQLEDDINFLEEQIERKKAYLNGTYEEDDTIAYPLTIEDEINGEETIEDLEEIPEYPAGSYEEIDWDEVEDPYEAEFGDDIEEDSEVEAFFLD